MAIIAAHHTMAIVVEFAELVRIFPSLLVRVVKQAHRILVNLDLCLCTRAGVTIPSNVLLLLNYEHWWFMFLVTSSSNSQAEKADAITANLESRTDTFA